MLKQEGQISFMLRDTIYAAVILNYNSYDLTCECINSLLKQNVNIEIVVVDNASTDDSLKKMFDKFDNSNVHIIKNNINEGYAKGNNIGIDYIHQNLKSIKFISIINPDIIIEDPNVFYTLGKKLMSDKQLSIIGCLNILNGNFYTFENSCWQFPAKRHLLFSGTLLGRFFCKKVNNIYKSVKVHSDIAYVDVVPGCFFLAKADDLYNVHGFDTNTFLYFEENIIAKKISNINKKLAICVNCICYHNHHIRDKQLTNWSSKIFSCKCFYNSKEYYIKTYSKQNKLFIIFSVLYNKFDYFVRNCIYFILRRFTKMQINLKHR